MIYMYSKAKLKSDGQTTSATQRDPPSRVNDSKDEILPRLEEILQSLLKQKQAVNEQWEDERLQFEQTLNSKDKVIQQLAKQNKILAEKVQTLTQDLEMSQCSLHSLQRMYQILQGEREGLKSVITYLENRNKELHGQFFQMERKLIRMEDQLKKAQPEFYLKKQSKKMVNCFDQESIFEYLGCQDSNSSRTPQLRKASSMPSFEMTPDKQSSQITFHQERQVCSSKRKSRKQKDRYLASQKQLAEAMIELSSKKAQQKLKKKGSAKFEVKKKPSKNQSQGTMRSKGKALRR